MPDVQRIIDEIRFYLQSDDLELTDDVRQLATDYAAACRDLNRRLKRCGDHLKQGLLSEAIHLAEGEPKLLEVLAVLDFPERPQWDEIISIYQLPRPEPLQLDIAGELNEAYATQKPLEQLLNRHRLLAVGRAPLRERLVVMRELAACDIGSAFWEDDVRAFETARLAEIEAAARGASARGDANLLQALRVEVEEKSWSAPPPKQLVQTVRRMADDIKRRTARTELEQVEQELNGAFGALDLPRGNTLRQRWELLVTQARLPADDEIFERAAPALGWLDDEKSRQTTEQGFQQSVVALERLLDSQTSSAAEIERGRHAILKFDRPIPRPLATRCATRVAALELSDRRRHQLQIGSVVAALIVVIAVVGLLIRNNLQATEVKRIAGTAEELIIANQLAEARQILEKNTSFSTWEAWLTAHTRLIEAEKKDEGRKTSLQAALESARNAQNVAAAESSLATARQLAREAGEKQELAKLEEHWRSARQKAAADAEGHFHSEIELVTQHLMTREKLSSQGDFGEQFIKAGREADRILGELRQSPAAANPKLTSELALLEHRRASVDKVASHEQTRRDLLDLLTQSASINPSVADSDQLLKTYVDTLKKYAATFKDEPRSKEFSEAASEADLWRGIFSWQRLVELWREWEPANIATAKNRSEQIQVWLKSHPGLPAANVARVYLTCLQSFVVREEQSGDKDEGLRARLLKLFSAPLLDGVYVLETNSGDRYYFTESQDFSRRGTTSVSFRYVNEFSGRTKSWTLPVAEMKSDRTEVAPQSDLAKGVRRDLPDTTLDKWDDYIHGLAVSVQSDKRMDPYLRYFLLLRVLEYASAGNAFLKPELESTLTRLRDDKIDLTAKWMDPKNQEATLARQRAVRALEAVRSQELGEAWVRAVSRKSRFSRLLGAKAMGIGWLMRDKTSHWNCRTTWKPGSRHVLYITTPPEPGSREAGWLVVGSADPTRGIALDASQFRNFKEGRLVFAGTSNETSP